MPNYSRIRSRSISAESRGVQVIGNKYAFNPNTNDFQPTPLQVMSWDQNLPWNKAEVTGDEKHPGPPYKTGGPFRNLKVTRVTPYGVQGHNTYLMRQGSPSAWRKYVGGFHPPAEHIFGGPVVNNTTVLNVNSSLFPDISSTDCDRAWKISKPKLERANLFVSIAELRDLPRMLKSTAQTFRDFWRGLGGDLSGPTMSPSGASRVFLNQEFGWRPFLRDLNQMINLVSEGQRIIRILSDQNGKPRRRKVTIYGDIVIGDDGKWKDSRPITTDSLVTTNNGLCCLPASLESGFYTVPPTYEVHEVVTDHITASSKWTYYNSVFDAGLEGFDSSLNNVRRYLTLYGLRVTPSNIYRATPWTWLVDWFTNFGDMVDRMSDAMVDETVCIYLYVTRVRTLTRKVVQFLPFREPGNLVLSWERVISTKERKSASSPYGFSLSWDDLTPRQLLILGALGLSR